MSLATRLDRLRGHAPAAAPSDAGALPPEWVTAMEEVASNARSTYRGLVWEDPDFDPKMPAVYYARVLEIPTPTWQAYDMAFFDTEMKADVPRSHQERAYTSPIWYSP